MMFIDEKAIQQITDKIEKNNIGIKNPYVALVLSLIIPGAGHIYLGFYGFGIMVIIIAFIAYPLLVAPGMAVAVFSGIAAMNYAKTINQILEEKETENIRTSIEQKKQIEKTINTATFVEYINKFYKLYKNEIISEKEFLDKKTSYIDNLPNLNIAESNEDFLFGLASLKESGSITKEEVDKIKTIIGQISAKKILRTPEKPIVLDL
jgi:TM2 domain-containing membrane protein YozV